MASKTRVAGIAVGVGQEGGVHLHNAPLGGSELEYKFNVRRHQININLKRHDIPFALTFPSTISSIISAYLFPINLAVLFPKHGHAGSNIVSPVCGKGEGPGASQGGHILADQAGLHDTQGRNLCVMEGAMEMLVMVLV